MSRFSSDDFLLRSEAGVNWYLREEEDGTTHIGAEQDTAPILDANMAIQNHSDGWSHDKTFRHIARIPLVVIEQWKDDSGINFHDENAAREVIRRLNSSEFYKLRTSNWKV